MIAALVIAYVVLGALAARWRLVNHGRLLDEYARFDVIETPSIACLYFLVWPLYMPVALCNDAGRRSKLRYQKAKIERAREELEVEAAMCELDRLR